MHGRFIPALSMLVAGLVASVICLLKKMDVIESLAIILLVLILFYVIGNIGKTIVRKTLSVSKEEETKEVVEEMTEEVK